MLFSADRELDVWESGEAVLRRVDLELVDEIGPGMAGGSSTFGATESSAISDRACIAWAAAPLIRRCALVERSQGTEVAMVELRSGARRVVTPTGS